MCFCFILYHHCVMNKDVQNVVCPNKLAMLAYEFVTTGCGCDVDSFRRARVDRRASNSRRGGGFRWVADVNSSAAEADAEGGTRQRGSLAVSSARGTKKPQPRRRSDVNLATDSADCRRIAKQCSDDDDIRWALAVIRRFGRQNRRFVTCSG